MSATLAHLSPDVRYHFRLVVLTHSTASATVATVRSRGAAFTTRPTGTLSIGVGRLRVTGTTVLVPQSCESDVRCHGRLTITTSSRASGASAGMAHRAVLCAASSFSVGAHRRVTVRVRLTAACRGLLSAAAHHRITATLLARPQTGQLQLKRSVVLSRD